MDTNREIDALFMMIRTRACRAIAYSNDEKARMELLDLLESAASFEVKIHKAMSDNKPIDTLLLDKNQELDEELLAEMGPVTKVIELKHSNEAISGACINEPQIDPNT